jgi:3-phenylpropionate/trans-cinnamate dioxygenase ferredoxin subunit
MIVDLDGRSIGIFHVGNEYYALRNRCPHQGGELCRGDLVGLLEADRPGEYRFDAKRKLLACPWHGWEFDLATGESFFDPERTRVRPFAVGVEPGRALALDIAAGESASRGGLRKGPYVAETFPVAVEDDYVVVTLGGKDKSRRGE